MRAGDGGVGAASRSGAPARSWRMKKIFLTVALLGAAACDDGATAVIIEHLPTSSILVEVSGGIAGADYAYERTPDDALVGVRCNALCDFAPGDTLHVLSEVQTGLLALTLGHLDDAPSARDYGVPCCDQFGYRITFSDGSEEATVSGAASTLPEPWVELVSLLDLLRRGIAPVIVHEGHPIEGGPADPVEILDAKLDAPFLDVTVRYGGGCARHDFDLIVASGWMESQPVQIDVALAHDAHDDPCDALPTETVRFDLTPLREDYAASYGSGSGAMVIHLEPASGGSRTTVAWSF